MAKAGEARMESRRRARIDERSRIFKAMAHPARLLMVEELGRGRRSVRELTRLVGADISTVSKHLSVLKRVGIVWPEKRGNRVFYHLRCPCVLEFFQCVEAVLAEGARMAESL
ncbi:MAG: metalloregulator ArsR/SmtB family transcription factor [Planctomycetota bacterium]